MPAVDSMQSDSGNTRTLARDIATKHSHRHELNSSAVASHFFKTRLSIDNTRACTWAILCVLQVRFLYSHSLTSSTLAPHLLSHLCNNTYKTEQRHQINQGSCTPFDSDLFSHLVYTHSAILKTHNFGFLGHIKQHGGEPGFKKPCVNAVDPYVRRPSWSAC